MGKVLQTYLGVYRYVLSEWMHYIQFKEDRESPIKPINYSTFWNNSNKFVSAFR